MHFRNMNFERMNEADVRGEIIDPLLRYLGYQAGTDFYVERERTLRWPHTSLGRKKASDPGVKGRCDYVVGIVGVGRWIIEAKAPAVEISQNDVEQAYTYASHPEVAASFFVLSNGKRLVVYRTIGGPEAGLLIDLTYNELSAKVHLLVNTLGPQNFRRAVLSQHVDVGRSLAPGMASTARIVGGELEYGKSTANAPALCATLRNLEGRRLSVEKGFVWRLQDQIAVKVEQGFFTQMHELASRQSGLAKEFLYLSSDQELSCDPEQLNIFETANRYDLRTGMDMLDMSSGRLVKLQHDLTLFTETEAVGHMIGDEFRGTFFGSARMIIQHPKVPEIQMEITGTFRLKVVT